VIKLEAVVIRERVETVIDAVEEETGHVGVTVVEAIGHGRQRGVTHEYRGRVFESRFLPKALLTFIVEDVGVLLARAGEEEQGFELLGGAEAIRAEIGSPRPPTLEVELEGHLASARATIGDEVADAAVARGRAWSFEDAIDAALRGAARVAEAARPPG